MTQTFTAQVSSHTRKYERRLDFIVKQSTQDVVSRASRTATGRSRGGTLRKGFVPRDTGILAGSLISRLHGGTVLSGSPGEDSYTMVVAGMRAGDVGEFAWTAPYARAQHYGYRTADGKRVGGWMWVDEAAADWQAIVSRNEARARLIR